VSDQMMMMMIN